ncbi:MAG: Flp pilus assembly complex ATPase component TadA [Deltaproteobacteria bacterium]|nr:Flp pilus assembly complex ATPase component TadA [Deltaproteobacteria bacterium]
MYSILVTEKGGERKRLDFEKAEVTIGRIQGNDVLLPKGNVSKRHARILLKDGKFIIVDARSTNGTYVNGRKITSPLVLQPADKIFIGDFMLQVVPPESAQEQAAPKGPPPRRRKNAPPPPLARPSAIPADNEQEVLPPLKKPAAEAHPSARRPSRRGRSSSEAAARHDGPAAARRDAMPAPGGHHEAPAAGHARKPLQKPTPAAAPQPEEPDEEAMTPVPAAPQEPRHAVPAATKEPKASSQRGKPTAQAESSPRPSATDPRRQKLVQVRSAVHDRLIQAMDLRRLDMDKLADDELWERAASTIEGIVGDMDAAGEIPSFVDRHSLIEDVLNEALGLGPLEEFLQDDGISEIMVNHAEQIYVERNGRIELSDKTFSSNKAVLGVIERIVAPIGRRIDESSPLVDARLKDGSRVNAIIPPLALKGPSITIRKFRREILGPDQLVGYGTATTGMLNFLKMCVEARKNTIISGGTGSGKTTTLNIVSNFIPKGERIITVEDAAELQIHHEHWIQLESRPPNIEGKGQIAIRDLVRNCLRMRPDRIIVGECRGGETLDMLQAMNTGHDGSLTTAHANNPRDTLARLETMVLMSGMDLPIRAIREQIASALDIIVHQTRFPDGSRKITNITEVTGMEGDVITMQDIFVFKQEGFDEENRVSGRFVATGFIPRFYEDLKRRGIPVDMSIFRE